MQTTLQILQKGPRRDSNQVLLIVRLPTTAPPELLVHHVSIRMVLNEKTVVVHP